MEQIDDLNLSFFLTNFGRKSFNLDVAERKNCFQALFNDQPFEPNGQSEAVHNIVARYEDIKDNFPSLSS